MHGAGRHVVLAKERTTTALVLAAPQRYTLFDLDHQVVKLEVTRRPQIHCGRAAVERCRRMKPKKSFVEDPHEPINLGQIQVGVVGQFGEGHPQLHEVLQAPHPFDESLRLDAGGLFGERQAKGRHEVEQGIHIDIHITLHVDIEELTENELFGQLDGGHCIANQNNLKIFRKNCVRPNDRWNGHDGAGP